MRSQTYKCMKCTQGHNDVCVRQLYLKG